MKFALGVRQLIKCQYDTRWYTYVLSKADEQPAQSSALHQKWKKKNKQVLTR